MKLKRLLCILLCLLCLIPVVSVTAFAEDKHDYPCYCEECIQHWNNEFSKFSSNISPLFSFKGFTGSLSDEYNGYYMFLSTIHHLDCYELILAETLNFNYNGGQSYKLSFSNYYNCYFPIDTEFFNLSTASLKNAHSFYGNPAEFNINIGALSDDGPKNVDHPQHVRYILYLPVSSEQVQRLINTDYWYSKTAILSYFEYPKHIPYIKFNIDGASGECPVSEHTDTLILPTATMFYKAGYIFKGWTDGINIYMPGQVIYPTSDITYTAVLERNKTTVEYINEGVVDITSPVSARSITTIIGFILGAIVIIYIALWAVKKALGFFVKALKGRFR